MPVFDEATVDAAIIGFIKFKAIESNLIYANIQKNDFLATEFEGYLTEIKRNFSQNTLNENTWAFESKDVLEIKQKVEAQGVPLNDWDLTINYGLKTGLNDAFVIDGIKEDRVNYRRSEKH